MINMITCPQCKKNIIWRFVYPLNRKTFRCTICGHAWSEKPKEVMGALGSYIGHWESAEMVKVELALTTPHNYNGPHDWRLFKGRHVWTGWREEYPKYLIIASSLDELIPWLCKGSKKVKAADWYKEYCKEVGVKFPTKPKHALDRPPDYLPS